MRCCAANAATAAGSGGAVSCAQTHIARAELAIVTRPRRSQ
jgi:hypothetical protein